MPVFDVRPEGLSAIKAACQVPSSKTIYVQTKASPNTNVVELHRLLPAGVLYVGRRDEAQTGTNCVNRGQMKVMKRKKVLQ
jgi:hypothetical protein